MVGETQDHPATADDQGDGSFCSDLHMGSEGEEEGDTVHLQRLRRAEEAWSKVRETALLTTLEIEGSFLESRFFCACAATCRCLDCGPSISMSLCESCAVEKHKTLHIFHHVEILKVRNCIIMRRK